MTGPIPEAAVEGESVGDSALDALLKMQDDLRASMGTDLDGTEFKDEEIAALLVLSASVTHLVRDLRAARADVERLHEEVHASNQRGDQISADAAEVQLERDEFGVRLTIAERERDEARAKLTALRAEVLAPVAAYREGMVQERESWRDGGVVDAVQALTDALEALDRDVLADPDAVAERDGEPWTCPCHGWQADTHDEYVEQHHLTDTPDGL